MARKISAGSESEDSLRLGGQRYKKESGGKNEEKQPGKDNQKDVSLWNSSEECAPRSSMQLMVVCP